MFLYDKKENSFDVYDFTAKKDDLISYRKNQIEKIPEEERIFIAETHTDPYGYYSPLFERYTGNTFNDRILFASDADNDANNDICYHILKRDNRSKVNNELLLNCYIFGHLEDRSVIRIKYSQNMKYYLLKRKKYDFIGSDEDGKNYKMEDIIQLPESLYLLQLLEQGKFTSFNGKDISEQLALYTLTKINEVSNQELEKMDACGITQDAYFKTREKAQNDVHVLRLIKK